MRSFLRSSVRRIRGDELKGLRGEVRELRLSVDHLNHVLGELNHDVRSGSDEVLPLFFGYAERLRTDADTVVSASAVIDRQLALLIECVDRLADHADNNG